MKNIVFMGTPNFAAYILERLIDDTEYQVSLVVTQPDRPVGRKQKMTPTPVKTLAQEHKIEVYQPEIINAEAAIKKITALEPDLILTVAYGQKIPESILNLPEFGAINVHPSLLPKYRGGAPIHYAVKNGDTKTGVTIMYMIEELDAGDMIAQTTFPIENDETTGELFEKLSSVSADLLLETLPKIFDQSIEPVPQNEDDVVYAQTISKSNERIDWNQSAAEIHNHIRALNPEPGAYTFYEGERFKIYQSSIIEEKTDLTPGKVVAIYKKQFQVACGDGTILAIREVQPAGKKTMPAVNFLNGRGSDLEVGYKLGQED